MSRTERMAFTMPDTIPTATKVVRVAPNEGHIPLDATVRVFTEDDHILTFKMLPNGSEDQAHHIALVDVAPPLTDEPAAEMEAYVEGDIIIDGREFYLRSRLSALSRTAFVAVGMVSNIRTIEIPLTHF